MKVLIVLYTFTGQFEQVKNVVDYEWLLFFPVTFLYVLFI
jgi:hypothetical protein